ncbi:hypothetical protein K438DRAFT_1791844 [Mycena galopus ATCC 62051]|nr:hypothetical protein K438DRAFT_1791844 [Mycena galopus ATCC 62051]
MVKLDDERDLRHTRETGSWRCDCVSATRKKNKRTHILAIRTRQIVEHANISGKELGKCAAVKAGVVDLYGGDCCTLRIEETEVEANEIESELLLDRLIHGIVRLVAVRTSRRPPAGVGESCISAIGALADVSASPLPTDVSVSSFLVLENFRDTCFLPHSGVIKLGRDTVGTLNCCDDTEDFVVLGPLCNRGGQEGREISYAVNTRQDGFRLGYGGVYTRLVGVGVVQSH